MEYILGYDPQVLDPLKVCVLFLGKIIKNYSREKIIFSFQVIGYIVLIFVFFFKPE